MSAMRASLAFELFRPTITRHAHVVAILLLFAAFWLAMLAGGNEPLVDSRAVPTAAAPPAAVTTKAGELDVPVYYFPDQAVGTDKWIPTRDADCGASSSTVPRDYPPGWLKL